MTSIPVSIDAFKRLLAKLVLLDPDVAGFDNVQDALAGIGEAPTLVASAHLNTFAIQHLHTDPITVVPAPGAGKMLVLQSAVVQLVAGTANLLNPSGSPAFQYGPTLGSDLLTVATRLIYDNMAQADAIEIQRILPIGSDDALVFDLPAHAENQPLLFAATADDTETSGPITAATLAAGGTGYVVGDTGTVDEDVSQGGATYVVDTVAAITGAVETFTITAGGGGYSTLDNPLATTAGGAQPGIGTDFTVNVTAIGPYTADIYLMVQYQILTLH